MFDAEMKALEEGRAGYATCAGQARTPEPLSAFLAEQLMTPREKIFDLCPYVPDWLQGFNFDCLRDDWPDTMCYLFPPEKIAAAAITRALLMWLNGKNVIFVGRELLLNRALDLCATRDVAVYAHLGSPIFEPFMHQATETYGVYLFLQPATMDYILKTRKTSKHNKRSPYKDSAHVKQLNAMIKQDGRDIVARMHWHGANNLEIQEMIDVSRVTIDKFAEEIHELETQTGQQCPAARNRRTGRH